MTSTLPLECFTLIPGNPIGKRIGLVKRGEDGYHTTSESRTFRALSDADLNREIDTMNTTDGVTKGQREAMEHGSMFGWDTPAADPDSWTPNGLYRGSLR